MIKTATGTATPIPAFAPVESPPPPDPGTLNWGKFGPSSSLLLPPPPPVREGCDSRVVVIITWDVTVDAGKPGAKPDETCLAARLLPAVVGAKPSPRRLLSVGLTPGYRG